MLKSSNGIRSTRHWRICAVYWIPASGCKWTLSTFVHLFMLSLVLLMNRQYRWPLYDILVYGRINVFNVVTHIRSINLWKTVWASPVSDKWGGLAEAAWYSTSLFFILFIFFLSSVCQIKQLKIRISAWPKLRIGVKNEGQRGIRTVISP